jgi:hypothetical protein
MPGRYGRYDEREIVGETGKVTLEREIVLLLRLRRTQSELDSARVPSFVFRLSSSFVRVDVSTWWGWKRRSWTRYV